MELRIQIVAIVAVGLLLLLILELVRRRRLQERYALLWLASGVVLLGLAAWRDALARVADFMGIAYPPNALFFVAFAFILLLLLHFSAAVSRLADQSKVLAQRVALMEQRLAEQEARDRGDGAAPAVEDADWAAMSDALVGDPAGAEPARRP